MNAEQTAIYNRYTVLCLAAYNALPFDADATDTMYEMMELAQTMTIDYLKSKGLWDCPEDEEESEWLGIDNPLWRRMDDFNDAAAGITHGSDEDEEASTPSEDEEEKSDDPC